MSAASNTFAQSGSLAGIPCGSVDIGLIVYNERAILGPTLDALLAAGFDSFVVLDMQSDDGTVDCIHQRLGDMARIVSLPRRALLEYGYAEVRNICACFVSREWLLFVDADEVLIGGVEDGRIVLTSHGIDPDIYHMKRHNLGRDPEAGPEAIKIASIEDHTRLYKPSLRMRYAGYIHEEIFSAGRSLYQDAGCTALVFDHYSDLKTVVDAEQKAGLYGLMLMRAYNQPDVRGGTNPWWFDTYVPQNMAATASRAAAFARQHGYPRSFYEALNGSNETLEESLDMASAPDEVVSYRPTEKYDVHDVGGLKYACPPSSFLNSYLASNIKYEPHVSEKLFSELKPGAVFVDVGANVGYYSINAAYLVGEQGKVISVEADQANCQCILFAAKANGFKNLNVWPVAASSTLKTEALLCDPMTNSGTRDLERVIEETYSLVVGMPLDNILLSEFRIDIIKIDIEAREHPAMLGCRDCLKKFKPIVFSEFSPHAMLAVGGFQAEDYLRYMISEGYNLNLLHLSGKEVNFGEDIDGLLKVLLEPDYAESKYLDLVFRPR